MDTSRKDEIIRLQNEIIQSMAKRNLRSVYNDFYPDAQPEAPAPKQPDAPAKPAATAASTGDGKPNTTAKAEETPKESMDDLMKELNGYIGLTTVKEQVDQLVHWIEIAKLRKEHGLPQSDLSLHMVFSGNPGTGKTMIARLMSRIFHSLGILSKGQLVEVDRGDLVAGYVGQTAIKTKEVINKAMGGVLFIDEAYALTNRGENDYGTEAVDTLLKAMEDHRDDLVVIVAGYTELMEEFVDSNPGLRSRFNKYLDFADYTAEEMRGIFALQCKKSQYTLDDDAEALLTEYFAAVSEAAGEFGNARGVRNTFEKVLTAQANRIAHEKDITRETLMRITKADVAEATGLPADESDGAPDESDTDKSDKEA